MTKYLLVYKTTGEPMPESTPEQMEAINEAWMSWGGKAGPAIIDFGSPIAPVGAADATIGGYSVLEAADAAALAALLEGHPHLASGGTIDTYEFLAIPGA